MRKALLLLSFGFVLFYIVVLRNPQSQKQLLSILATPVPTATPIPGITLDYNDTNLRVQWFVSEPKDISLYSNFAEKLPAYQLKQQKNCTSLINGGFYSENDTPLGLLISNGYTESEYRTNSLFNGIFGVSFGDIPFLGETYQRGSTRIAIQSGPVLIRNSKVQTLQLKNDEYARRNVVAVNENEVIFMTIYQEESELLGPLLVDLPQIISQFARDQGITIANALNLDGGSASAFYTPGSSVQEVSYIGSYFCIN